jgi:RHS repeat-associated protein
MITGLGGLSAIASSGHQRRSSRAPAKQLMIVPPSPSYVRHVQRSALLTPRQRKQAALSRSRYRGLDGRAALSLARRRAGVLGLAGRFFYQPLMLSKGERLIRFINAHEALVREPPGRRSLTHPSAQSGRTLIAQSNLPMTVGRGSHMRPVSLTLRRAGSFLSPVAPLIPIAISPGRVSFTSEGVSVSLEGAHSSPIRNLGRESFQASVFADTDLVMQPLAVGAEQWLQLRSPAAPQRFRFGLHVPAGATARLQTDGSVKIVRSKSLLLYISRASATDALGRPVSAAFHLVGSELSLTVSHRHAREITYPVAVDPIEVGTPCVVPHVQDPYQFIDSECGSGGTGFGNTGPGSTPDTFGQWNYMQAGAAMGHGVSSGLFLYTNPGTYYSAGDFGEYVYQAPPGAFINRADFENTEHSLSGFQASDYFEGIFTSTGWETESVSNGLSAASLLGALPYQQFGPDSGGDNYLFVGNSAIPPNPENLQPMSNVQAANGNAAVFGLAIDTPGVRSSSAPDLAYMQGATIWIYDFNSPVIDSPLPQSSTQWTDDGNQTYSQPLYATENGLGIKSFALTSLTQGNQTKTLAAAVSACTGDHTGAGYCPHDTGIGTDPNTGQPYQWQLQPFTYQLPEGDETLTLTAESALQFPNTDSVRERIDRSSPTVGLNGSLYAARVETSGGSSQQNPLLGSSYPLQINASDTASGVAEVDVSVDGGAPTVFQGNCVSGTGPTSGCDQSATFNYAFQTSNYPAGEHTITVTAKDCLGAGLPAGSTTTSVCGGAPLATHVSSAQTFHVWTQPPASLTNPPTPAQNDTLGLEKYYDYRTIATGAGSMANVNLATGNVVWNDVPVIDPGQGLATFVQVTYNSQQRLGDLNLITQNKHGQILNAGYDQIGQGFSLGIDGLTRLNEPLDLSQVANTPNPEISFTDIDGTHHTFVYSSGRWVAPPGVFLRLRAWNPAPYTAGVNGTWDKAWAITRPDGVTFFFDGLGYESAIQDRNGNTITFQRNYVALGAIGGSGGQSVCTGNSVTGLATTLLGVGCAEQVTAVTDQNNKIVNGQNTRALAVSYNPSTGNGANLISSITDHAGHVLQFTYDANGDMISMTAASKQNFPRTFQFGYGGTTDAAPALTTATGVSLIPGLSGLLGSLGQVTGLFQPGLTSIADPNVSASGQGSPTTITYAATPATGTSLCPEPTSSTYPQALAALLNIEPKCVTQIAARDGGHTSFTYNDQQQPAPQNTGCSATALECTRVTGPQTDQGGKPENWTDSIDSAFRPVQQVDPLGRETLTTWNNATTGSTGGICSTAQSATGCESGPANTVAGQMNGLIASGYASDPSATTTPAATTVLFSYDPNGDTTEQQGPANISAGESQSFRDIKTTYQESAGTLLSPSGTDQGGQFVADETSHQLSSASGPQTTSYTLDPANPADGLVTVVKDPDNQTWKTDYFPAGPGVAGGLIKDHIDPLGNDTQFGNSSLPNDGYDPNGLPETITAPGQATPTTYQYDADGNLLARTDPRNATPASLNGLSPTSATATSPFTTYHAYDDLNEQTDKWVPKDSTHGVFIHRSTAYDHNGNATTQTDGNQHATTDTYTSMDYLASKSSPAVQDAGEQAPAPEVTSYCYDLNGNQTYQALPAGQPWSCTGTSPTPNHVVMSVYDASGEPLIREQLSTTPGTQDQLTSYAYDARGNQVGTADATDNAGAAPLVAEANAQSALSNTAGPWRTRTAYDSANDPIEVDANPAASNGQIYRTLNQYDAAGNLLATESAKEADSKTANANQTLNASTGEYAFSGESGMTTYKYDNRNLLLSNTNPDGNLTEYARQADGKICAVLGPDGTALSTPTTDDCTTPGSYKTTYTYFPQGWLKQIGLPTAPGEHAYNAALQVSYGRDLVGDPTSITDPNGATITNSFFDTGDLATTSAPWWWTYDPNGTGTPGPDPNGGGAGQVASDTPDAGLPVREKTLSEIYQATALNSTTASLPPDGISGGFGDVTAQPLPRILPSAGQTSLGYDNEMRLAAITDAQGAQGTTTLTYDPLERLSELDQPFDGKSFSTTKYSYDQDSNLASTTTPAVATLSAPGAANSAPQVAPTTANTYDGLDRLSSTTAAGAGAAAPLAGAPTQTTRYCYYLAPPKGTVPVGGGVPNSCPIASITGAPATVTAPGGVSFQVAERVQVIDPASNASNVDYDALGNQLSATDPLGNMTSYAYDELGSQTAVVRPAGQTGVIPNSAYTTSNTYDVAGRLTLSTDGSAHPTTYAYDPAGNLLTESRPGAASAQGGSTTAQVTSYRYNGRGLHASVTTGTGNDARTTVTETDGNGNPVRTVDPAGVGSNGGPYSTYTGNYNATPSTSSLDPDQQNSGANLDATIRVFDPNNRLEAVYLPWGCNQTANTTKASCVPQAPASGKFTSAQNDDARRFVETLGPSTDGMDRTGSVTQAYDWTNTDLPSNTTSPQYKATYAYMPNGWILQNTGPQLNDKSQQSTIYAYDPAGDQTSASTTGTDASQNQLGRSSNRSYWPNGQAQQVDGQANTALAHRYNYFYAPTGQLSELDGIPSGDQSGAQANETDKMCYDPAGRLTRVNQIFTPAINNQSGFDTVQTYDANGNLSTRSTNGVLGGSTCPTPAQAQSGTPPPYTGGQQTTFAYNNLDQETSMTVKSTSGTTPAQPTRTFTTSYWPSGQQQTQTRQQASGTAVTENWFYNDNGQTSQDINSSEGKNQLYSYDTDGNLTATENGTHLYNALDQEVQWTRGGPNTAFPASTAAFVHDGAGALLEQITNTTQKGAVIPSVGLGTVTKQVTSRYCSNSTATTASGMNATQAAAQPLCAQDGGRVENTTATSTTSIAVLGLPLSTASGSTTSTSCYNALANLSATVKSPDTCATSTPQVSTTTSYTYNSFGQLRQATAPDPVSGAPNQTLTDAYLYDALGRRFQKTETLAGGPTTPTSTTNYGYVGLTGQVTQDSNTNSTGTHSTNTYDYNSSGDRSGFYTMSATSSSYYSYATNSGGSVEGLEASNGKVAANDQYHYTSYGDLELGSNQGAAVLNPPTTSSALSQEAQANDFLFEGFQYDHGTDSYAMPAREYTPASGSYLTSDQFESSTANQTVQIGLATQDPYGYAAGNPTSLIEVDGHTVCGPNGACHGAGPVTSICEQNGTCQPTAATSTGGVRIITQHNVAIVQGQALAAIQRVAQAALAALTGARARLGGGCAVPQVLCALGNAIESGVSTGANALGTAGTYMGEHLAQAGDQLVQGFVQSIGGDCGGDEPGGGEADPLLIEGAICGGSGDLRPSARAAGEPGGPRVDRGDGRDSAGKFTGAGGYGKTEEAGGLAQYSEDTGNPVITQKVRANLGGAQRYYDGLVKNPDGTYTGIEVKSGGARYYGAQKRFDAAVSPENPAIAVLNSETIDITATYLVRVP